MPAVFDGQVEVPFADEAAPVAPLATPEVAPGTPEAPGGSASSDELAGTLIAVDIGWQLGDLSTMAGDDITLTVEPGATIEVVNEGAAYHDFTVAALGISVPIGPGAAVAVAIPDDVAPGEYAFMCSVRGHAAVIRRANINGRYF